jgi:phage FluMu protein Com
MPYLKAKCIHCGRIVHLYFEENEMLDAENGEYLEHYCHFCQAMSIFEVLE